MSGEEFRRDDLPSALTAREQWVCWRLEERDGTSTKVPVDASVGKYASTTDPATWTDVETAIDAIDRIGADGIGFVFTHDDPLVGVDLDACRDPESGELDKWARNVIDLLDSYSEISPSGTGVHVIVEGELPGGRNRSGDIEMYETSRFFTVTGDRLEGAPCEIEWRDDAIRAVHSKYVQRGETERTMLETAPTDSIDGDLEVDLDDRELLDRARTAANGDRFNALWRGDITGYDSQSEADMALCLHLGFWTSGDASQMDGLFRQSGLMREKWDEVHFADGATYGERTIERALQRVDKVYEPDSSVGGSDGSMSMSPTEASGGARDGASSQKMRDESVYLEERNRLLLENVRAQQATIEDQATRLSELERELEAIRKELTARENDGDHQKDQPRLWNRFRARISES